MGLLSSANRVWTLTYKGHEISHYFISKGLEFEHFMVVNLPNSQHRFSNLKDAENHIDCYIWSKKLEDEINNGTITKDSSDKT
mgnify:CR=1 FL=1